MTHNERLDAAVKAGQDGYFDEAMRADHAGMIAADIIASARRARAKAIIASIFEPDGGDIGTEAALMAGSDYHRAMLAGIQHYRKTIRQRAGLEE
jgi:hypothetical protein